MSNAQNHYSFTHNGVTHTRNSDRVYTHAVVLEFQETLVVSFHSSLSAAQKVSKLRDHKRSADGKALYRSGHRAIMISVGTKTLITL